MGTFVVLALFVAAVMLAPAEAPGPDKVFERAGQLVAGVYILLWFTCCAAVVAGAVLVLRVLRFW